MATSDDYNQQLIDLLTRNEEQRIALGFPPRTLRGWWFWLCYWSPPALWLLRWRRGER